jgi:D-3-phosphoglycerate dehydrogenase / 2-oxoglutarate reductase
VRILVAEPIAAAGIERLCQVADVDVETELDRPQLLERIGRYDALVVRSATHVDAELIAAADRLRVIGRAGMGVDNVDVDAATARGILVCNAPQSNSISAAEHAIALMLALARNIPQAHAELVQGRWERSRFGGIEVADKVLAVIGFGRIGQLVTTRARALGMRVVAYDPFASAERFRERGAERAATLEAAVAEADFVTLHAPSSAETRHLVDAGLIERMKFGVRIINAARGDLIDPDALLEALDGGHVAGAALDVFETEPLTSSPFFGRDDVVVTPHLGASTREAQDRAGTIIADQVVKALAGELVENAVNVPGVSEDDRAALAPYLPLAEKLGRIVVSLTDGPVEMLEVSYAGSIGDRDTRLLTLAVLEGALHGLAEGDANLINGRAIAQARGIEVRESRRPAGDYTNLIRVATSSETRVSGTTIGRENRPWMVRANGYQVEIELAGRMLFALNDDRPGMIGTIGTLLGEAGVNVANMNVSRNRDGGHALSAMQIDGPLPDSVLDRLRVTPGLERVRVVQVDPD